MLNWVILICSSLFVLHSTVVITGLNEATNRMETIQKAANDDIKAEALFREFVVRHNKTYANDKAEFKKRFQVFKQSLRRQANLNMEEEKLGGTAWYGVNQFSDWTPAEFRDFLRKGVKRIQPCHTDVPCCHHVKLTKPLPSKINWATLGKVTTIKNQGKCGSCWAFSGAEIIETQWAIDRGSLLELSVQELVDCSEQNGCGGGDTCSALTWLQENNAQLVHASEYPYKDAFSACKQGIVTKGTGVKIKYPCGCRNVSETSVMMPVVASHGTWAVNVDATMWHDYLGGIIQHHCSDQDINHAVQITGYDTTGPVPYWILRNSWGPLFGMDGYLHVAIGKNLCGLAGAPTYVVV